MKSKDKVLKMAPNAICAIVRLFEGDAPDYQIWVNKESLSKMQPRESWAWAEAYRNIKPHKKSLTPFK